MPIYKTVPTEKGNARYKIMIKGPMGRGLGVDPYKPGHHVLIAGGTGVLPFLDFFYFVLKKVMREVV